MVCTYYGCFFVCVFVLCLWSVVCYVVFNGVFCCCGAACVVDAFATA